MGLVVVELVDTPIDLEVEVGEPVARFINDIVVEGGGVFAAALLGKRLFHRSMLTGTDGIQLIVDSTLCQRFP